MMKRKTRIVHNLQTGDEEERLLGVSAPAAESHKAGHVNESAAKWAHFRANLHRLRKLFFP